MSATSTLAQGTYWNIHKFAVVWCLPQVDTDGRKKGAKNDGGSFASKARCRLTTAHCCPILLGRRFVFATQDALVCWAQVCWFSHPVFGESMFLCLVCLVCLFFVAPCLLATPRKSEPRSPIPRNAMTSVHPEVPPMDEMPQTEQPNVISLRNWSFNMALFVNVCN